MIIIPTITLAIIGLLFTIKAKKIFEKGLCESDSYRMISEFNKSRRMRRYSTICLLTSMLLFIIYIFELLITSNT